jgi:hypothetical protein
MIHWPAVIRYSGNAELGYIDNQSDWENAPHFHSAHYHPEDVLIDSTGQEFVLQDRLQANVLPTPTGKTLTLEEVIQLVRLHAAQDGACCASKLFATSIAAAISMVK